MPTRSAFRSIDRSVEAVLALLEVTFTPLVLSRAEQRALDTFDPAELARIAMHAAVVALRQLEYPGAPLDLALFHNVAAALAGMCPTVGGHTRRTVVDALGEVLAGHAVRCVAGRNATFAVAAAVVELVADRTQPQPHDRWTGVCAVLDIVADQLRTTPQTPSGPAN